MANDTKPPEELGKLEAELGRVQKVLDALDGRRLLGAEEKSELAKELVRSAVQECRPRKRFWWWPAVVAVAHSPFVLGVLFTLGASWFAEMYAELRAEAQAAKEQEARKQAVQVELDNRFWDIASLSVGPPTPDELVLVVQTVEGRNEQPTRPEFKDVATYSLYVERCLTQKCKRSPAELRSAAEPVNVNETAVG